MAIRSSPSRPRQTPARRSTPQTCAADGYCGVDTSIKYVGADGKKYSATVRGYPPPTGTPTYSTRCRGQPGHLQRQRLRARRGHRPDHLPVALPEGWLRLLRDDSSATLPVIGPPTRPSRRHGHLHLADRRHLPGRADGDRCAAYKPRPPSTVKVASVAPTLTLAPDCAANPSVPCNTSTADAGSAITLSGTVGHTGSLDNFLVRVNWGDGSKRISPAPGPAPQPRQQPAHPHRRERAQPVVRHAGHAHLRQPRHLLRHRTVIKSPAGARTAARPARRSR